MSEIEKIYRDWDQLIGAVGLLNWRSYAISRGDMELAALADQRLGAVTSVQAEAQT